MADDLNPDDRPGWLPEKFKTPEDLARSYEESEKRMGHLQSQLDKERSDFGQALQQIEAMRSEPTQQVPPGQDPFIQNYAQAMESGDAAAMLAMNVAVMQQAVGPLLEEKFGSLGKRVDAQSSADAKLAETLAQERLSREFGEEKWQELGPKVSEFMAGRPHWAPQQASVEAYEQSYREAARVIEADRIVSAQQAAEQDRQAKLSAQTMSGSSAGRVLTPDEQQQKWDRIKGASTGSYGNIVR